MSDDAEQVPLSSRSLDLTGRDLGDYHILHRLNRGGMADVYLAEQRSLRRRVALKVLQGRLAGDALYIQRFQNEARNVAALVHANIVQIYEVGVRDGIHFIAQEYVDGPNLRQLIARHGTLDAARLVRILRQVVAALQKAAQVGIVHRDIKPENIRLTATGEVKVADFGLARAANSSDAQHLTQEGITLGTPLYMSPEQVEGRTVDPRSDLYSLGATAYFVLAGRPPFEGETSLAIALQHLRTTPAPLATQRPDLPSELCDLVHKLLAKQPADRFQSPRELLTALRTLSLNLPHTDEALGPLDWDEGLALSGAESIGPELTQKLDLLMKRTAQPREVSWAGRWLVLAMLLAGIVGAAMAIRAKSSSLLGQAKPQQLEVERRESAKEQFFLAMQLGTPEGYESVREFFPATESELNAYYVHRSAQQLGELYFGQDNWKRAYEAYDRLATLNEEDDVEFRVSGLVGQANVHAVRGESSQATRKLALAVPLLQKLKPNVRAQIVQQMAPKLRPTYEQMLRDGNLGV
ncbi:MAG: serine/threonine-protein kinase [Planctomycetota bacterium]